MRQDDNFVFIVNNQITALVTKSVIDLYSLATSKVYIIYLRGLKFDFLEDYTSFYHFTDVDKTLITVSKVFNSGHLFTPWMFDLPEKMVKIFKMQFSYIEEGTLSYSSFHEYALMPWFVRKYLLKTSSKNWFFKRGAFQYYSITESAFLNRSKVIVPVSDKGYNYFLKDGDVIILVPPIHRFSNFDLDQFLKFINENYVGNYIKFHPSFGEISSKKRELIKSLGFSILDHNCILELEMIRSHIEFYGTFSSVRIYSDLFNRPYTFIDFPDYRKSNRY